MNTPEVMAVLNDPVSQRLLHAPIPARLAFTGLDGAPRVLPIACLWRDDTVVMATATTAAKVRALQVNPRVALTIDTESYPPNILLLRGTATLETVAGVPDDFLAATHKSLDPSQWETFDQGVHATYRQMVLITVRIDWAKVLDFETHIPTSLEQLGTGQNS